MTQPAKVQEPSMEEILASIRRIIADDEGKPPAAEKAAAPDPVKAEKPAAPAPKPVMSDIPPSKIAAAAPAKPAPPPPAPPPAAAASNSQDDIDALLAGLDETTPAAEARPAEPEPAPEPEVLELTDDMAVAPPTPAPAPAPAPAAASFRKVDPQDDIEFIESGRLNQKAASFETSFDPVTPKQPILAPSTVNAVESAFNALANTVLSNNARTLEDLVKEMLRPMLKSWLDDNLPALVERIVKAEIERVSRGR
ncbi:PopZ family protein [Bradyrhizobium oligotrophicum]|uniref:PopZ family protein n=1 Tax=Bradyrhizobium oligotrophicum TaxID=44255 RepID=UPI003EB999B1